MKEDLVRTNIVVPKELKDLLRKEANAKFGGNVSIMCRHILYKYFKIKGSPILSNK